MTTLTYLTEVSVVIMAWVFEDDVSYVTRSVAKRLSRFAGLITTCGINTRGPNEIQLVVFIIGMDSLTIIAYFMSLFWKEIPRDY